MVLERSANAGEDGELGSPLRRDHLPDDEYRTRHAGSLAVPNPRRLHGDRAREVTSIFFLRVARVPFYYRDTRKDDHHRDHFPHPEGFPVKQPAEPHRDD